MNGTLIRHVRRNVGSLIRALCHDHQADLRIKDLSTRYDVNQLQRFQAVLERNGFSLSTFSSILDFGCGPGRHIAQLLRVTPKAQIFGCDISNQNIEECRAMYLQAYFIQNRVKPPIAFDDNQFDFIYSYSVFTHLSEHNQREWLGELSRILKPGGVMLHTTHSYECLFRLQFWSPERLDKYKLPDPVEEFTIPEERYHYALENELTPEYGYTIISQGYVIKNWRDYSKSEIVEYVAGAIEAYPEGCQDIVLLRKPEMTPLTSP